MRRACLVLLALLSASGTASGAPQIPQRISGTTLPWSLDRGDWEFSSGVTHRDSVHPPFFGEDSSARRDELLFCLVDATVGLGSGGEAQIRFGVQRIDPIVDEDRTGVLDPRITITYELPLRQRLSAALRLEVKLPSAGDEHRLGTDQMDLFLTGAVGRKRVVWGWAAEAGLAILGHPLRAGVQDDLIVFGATGWWNGGGDRLRLFAEISGMAASRFSNDSRVARAGMQIGRRRPIDLAVRRGLTSESETWGLEAGVTWIRPGRP